MWRLLKMANEFKLLHVATAQTCHTGYKNIFKTVIEKQFQQFLGKKFLSKNFFVRNFTILQFSNKKGIRPAADPKNPLFVLFGDIRFWLTHPKIF